MTRAITWWLAICAVACAEHSAKRPHCGRLTERIVEPLPPAGIDSIDLLFVIDDSSAMSDKQAFLAETLPDLVEALVAQAPTVDMHLGVITSSLGGHGSDACVGEEQSDRAHLLAENGMPTDQDLGFLFWDPTGEDGGDTDEATFAAKLSTMVLAAGDRGCGYEAPLEAWYRFLIEPDPHATIGIEGGQAVLQGTDEVLLAQRRAFLRPDSLLTIVLLTDENDCSIRDGGQFFFALQQSQPGASEPYHLPKPRAACATDPNDACCRSCGQTPGEGCSEALDDCGEPLSAAEDPHSLRCFDQKRRFGIDFMWPIDRYVDGLTQLDVTDRHGNVVDNPIFTDLAPDDATSAVRDPSLVLFAGIVGLPWHDLARRDDAGLPDASAGLQTSTEMQEEGTWDLILGDPSCYPTDPTCLPTDPLMHESVEPRSGVHPLTGDALAPPGSPPLANPINGHERDLSAELQYACIMPLVEPRDCATSSAAGCPCTAPDDENPLCQDDSGAYGTVQYYAGAKPGIRHLQALERLGDRGIVGSACAAPQDVGHGYASSIAKLADRLAAALRRGRCLPRALPLDEERRAPCTVVEARQEDDCAAACAEPGRRPLEDANIAEAILDEPEASMAGWSCFCEMDQLEDEALATCRQDASTEDAELTVDGWCYLDAEAEPPIGDPDLVATCPDTERRRIRFVGAAADRGPLFITCGDGPEC